MLSVFLTSDSATVIDFLSADVDTAAGWSAGADGEGGFHFATGILADDGVILGQGGDRTGHGAPLVCATLPISPRKLDVTCP